MQKARIEQRHKGSVGRWQPSTNYSRQIQFGGKSECCRSFRIAFKIPILEMIPSASPVATRRVPRCTRKGATCSELSLTKVVSGEPQQHLLRFSHSIGWPVSGCCCDSQLAVEFVALGATTSNYARSKATTTIFNPSKNGLMHKEL